MTEIGVEAEFALDEPSLSYHRLENDCPLTYTNTEITTVAAHQRFIALGYMDGSMNIFDHLGNLIQNGSYKKHFKPVNQLRISNDGNFILSCADDGFVCIYNLPEPTQSECINLSHPVKTVAISSEYSRNKKVISGGKCVTLHSRGVLGIRTTEDLYVPPKCVENVTWRENILVWADDSAVRVFDIRKRQVINYISKPQYQSTHLEGQPQCQLAWHSNSCFLIGWGKTAYICQITAAVAPTFQAKWSTTTFNDGRESVCSYSPISGQGSPSRLNFRSPVSSGSIVQITSHLDLTLSESRGVICGITTHQDRVLLLLSSSRSNFSLLVGLHDEVIHDYPPRLLVANVGEALTAPLVSSSDVSSITSIGHFFEEISCEDLMLKVSPGYDCHGIGLVSVPGEDAHIIFSRRDMIYAQALSADNRIDWYLEQDLPQRALQIANENPSVLVRHSNKNLGMTYLTKLIEEKNYVGAAALCKNILTDKNSWEEQIYRFLHLGVLHVVVPYLPTSKNLISSSTYEVILIDLLSKSPQTFLLKLKDWPPNSGLYSVDPIIAAVQEKTSSCSYQDMFTVAERDADMRALWCALIVLYEHASHPEKGLELSIKLKDNNVFDLIRRQLPGTSREPFASVVRKNIIALCEIDLSKALLLMIDCIRELPVDFVVQDLDAEPMLLYKYLDALNARHPQAVLPHVHRLLKLYASYSREKLLPFLRLTDQYPLNEALTLCQSLNYIPETVYLLTRVGRRKDALRLLMEKGAQDALLLRDKTLTPEMRQAEVAAQAIAYCLEEGYTQNMVDFITFDVPKKQQLTLNLKADQRDDDSRETTETGALTRNYGQKEGGKVYGSSFASSSSSREVGELWNQVVLFAVDKPSFICALLKHATTERIDLTLLLRKIALNTEIPTLKESLNNLLRNTKMQMELRRNSQNILLKDSHDIFSCLVRIQRRGVYVDIQKESGSDTCRICRQSLFGSTKRTPTNNLEIDTLNQLPLFVFLCSHVFHQACLSHFGKLSACPVCLQDPAAT